jgi:cardiolipin synthase
MISSRPLGVAAGYARAIAYMLQARWWTLSRGEPAWPQLQAQWGAAETDSTICETLAGRLAATDVTRLIGSGEEGFALRDTLYRQAARSVDIATYYLQPDDTGRATIRELAACASRGVAVRLLVDRFMTAKKSAELRGMEALFAEARAAGIQLKIWHDADRPYDSNHRKMIVIDGHTAIVGGRNFADHYRGDEWRDADLVIDGPSVAPLTILFDALWAGPQSGGHLPSAISPWIDYVPAGIASDPIMLGVLSAIGAARRRIDLELAYFVAHDSLCDALARATGRGVRVRLLTNSAESNDLPYATWTAYEGARRVLEAGGSVHVRRGAGRTLHSKYVVVDDDWINLGSHNLDYYSPRYCCETNLMVRDAGLAALLTDFFETGLLDATPLSLAEVRPFLERHVLRRAFDRGFRDFQ